MKSTLIGAAVALAMGLNVAQLHAQGQTTQPGVPTAGNTVDDDADQSNRNRGSDDMNRKTIDAEDFVETASAKGHAEIENARMALEDGSPAVHAFANLMIEDHNAANVELRQIAERADMEMSDDPTLMDQAKAMILEVRDDSFDKAYIDNQISAHEETIELFERAARSDHAQIRGFAQQKLPILQAHLRMANELKVQHDRNN
ncbi:MAG: DUF4142 domain-containing protein [Pseudohongiella sp.]|uniref:DUF4142 domain-containing protein n=1 Tax=Pseudohongiella sp. TaxID=1979412 RepID=UPI0034A068A6